jgi:hypothetical protein
MKEILALLAAAESEESAKKFDGACGRSLSCQLVPPGQRKRCGSFSRHYPELMGYIDHFGLRNLPSFLQESSTTQIYEAFCAWQHALVVRCGLRCAQIMMLIPSVHHPTLKVCIVQPQMGKLHNAY